MAVSSQLRLFLVLAILATSGAFAPNFDTIKTSWSTTNSQQSSVALFESKQPKKGGLEEGVRSKLLSESIAPWRTIRLFLYGSLGSGAFIGGLINISGAVAKSASPVFDLNTEVRCSSLHISRLIRRFGWYLTYVSSALEYWYRFCSSSCLWILGKVWYWQTKWTSNESRRKDPEKEGK